MRPLELMISTKNERSILAMNQLLNVFSCYRSALCSVLDVCADLPLAIGSQGEWVIWRTTDRQSLNDIPLSPSMLTDLHQFFFIEKLYAIDVFGSDHPQWIVGLFSSKHHSVRVHRHDLWST